MKKKMEQYWCFCKIRSHQRTKFWDRAKDFVLLSNTKRVLYFDLNTMIR